MFESEKERKRTYLVFGLYLFILIWLVMFKFSFDLRDISRLRNINLIPFRYAEQTSPLSHKKEVFENILIFIPMGIYALILRPKAPLWKNMLIGLYVSLAFETAQYIFALGASDITDLMTNTAGGILGIGIFLLMKKIFKEKTLKVINSLGLVAAGILGAGLVVLGVGNL
ncbi:MAG: VanZ family protein [Eubacteriaceae bacterium]|nr:VanZ family protein [Eubacteriaceae bacterium]